MGVFKWKWWFILPGNHCSKHDGDQDNCSVKLFLVHSLVTYERLYEFPINKKPHECGALVI
jgi:hypothetical protein